MSAVLAREDCFTYSSLESGSNRARHTEPPADVFSEPELKRVRTYLVTGSFGRTEDGRILNVRDRFRVYVEEMRISGEREGYIATLQADASRVGGGESELAALEALSNNLLADYEIYTTTADEGMTRDAQEYKHLLQRLFIEAKG